MVPPGHPVNRLIKAFLYDMAIWASDWQPKIHGIQQLKGKWISKEEKKKNYLFWQIQTFYNIFKKILEKPFRKDIIVTEVADMWCEKWNVYERVLAFAN